MGKKYKKTCLQCGKTFYSNHKDGKYCFYTCANRKYQDRFEKSQWKVKGISSGAVGAINELLVCSDLLGKGYHIFRSVSQACPCDLIMMKNGSILKVEVKTGRISKDRSFRQNPHPDRARYDVLAVVADKEIFYDPPIEDFKAKEERSNERVDISNDQRGGGLSEDLKNHSLPNGGEARIARSEARQAVEIPEVRDRGMVQMELEGLKKFTP